MICILFHRLGKGEFPCDYFSLTLSYSLAQTSPAYDQTILGVLQLATAYIIVHDFSFHIQGLGFCEENIVSFSIVLLLVDVYCNYESLSIRFSFTWTHALK
ncbi:hypothetical protein I3842_03G096200 [Carya illinoinensis]|uniref:Uncharacterized protein n=1 Tax=Carya illinoinensis TaxID=32201 RepID=A0A922FIB0_CARIL|nr:hypothetical protein I3842_03G096200 [Carya illinoinensis]